MPPVQRDPGADLMAGRKGATQGGRGALCRWCGADLRVDRPAWCVRFAQVELCATCRVGMPGPPPAAAAPRRRGKGRALTVRRGAA